MSDASGDPAASSKKQKKSRKREHTALLPLPTASKGVSATSGSALREAIRDLGKHVEEMVLSWHLLRLLDEVASEERTPHNLFTAKLYRRCDKDGADKGPTLYPPGSAFNPHMKTGANKTTFKAWVKGVTIHTTAGSTVRFEVEYKIQHTAVLRYVLFDDTLAKVLEYSSMLHRIVHPPRKINQHAEKKNKRARSTSPTMHRPSAASWGSAGVRSTTPPPPSSSSSRAVAGHGDGELSDALSKLQQLHIEAGNFYCPASQDATSALRAERDTLDPSLADVPADSAHLALFYHARLINNKILELGRVLNNRERTLVAVANAAGQEALTRGMFRRGLIAAAKIVEFVLGPLLRGPLGPIRVFDLAGCLKGAFTGDPPPEFPPESEEDTRARHAVGQILEDLSLGNLSHGGHDAKLRTPAAKLRAFCCVALDMAGICSIQETKMWKVTRTLLRALEGSAVSGKGARIEMSEGRLADWFTTVKGVLKEIADTRPPLCRGDTICLDNFNLQLLSMWNLLDSMLGGSSNQRMLNAAAYLAWPTSKAWETAGNMERALVDFERITTQFFSMEISVPFSCIPEDADFLVRLQQLGPPAALAAPVAAPVAAPAPVAPPPSLLLEVTLEDFAKFRVVAKPMEESETPAAAAAAGGGGGGAELRCEFCREPLPEGATPEDKLCVLCATELFYKEVAAMKGSEEKAEKKKKKKEFKPLDPQSAGKITRVNGKGQAKLPDIAAARRNFHRRRQDGEKRAAERYNNLVANEAGAAAPDAGAVDVELVVLGERETQLHELAQKKASLEAVECYIGMLGPGSANYAYVLKDMEAIQARIAELERSLLSDAERSMLEALSDANPVPVPPVAFSVERYNTIMKEMYDVLVSD